MREQNSSSNAARVPFFSSNSPQSFFPSNYQSEPAQIRRSAPQCQAAPSIIHCASHRQQQPSRLLLLLQLPQVEAVLQETQPTSTVNQFPPPVSVRCPTLYAVYGRPLQGTTGQIHVGYKLKTGLILFATRRGAIARIRHRVKLSLMLLQYKSFRSMGLIRLC